MRQKGSWVWQVMGRTLLAVLLLAALAYPASRFGLFEWPRAYDPLALPDLAAKPGFLTDWQMKLLDADAEGCAVAMRRAGLPTTLLPARGSGKCVVDGAVTLSRLSQAKLRPEATRCAMAARLYMWERNALQPAARRHFGQQVTEITHFGSYSCRTMRGSASMSEHATANAFDVSGFRLANGRLVTLKKDWHGDTTTRAFLREVRDSLCDGFNVTLSPDYNADHADHFHVDMGWWRTCR